jgi:threonylcarbamoyladenosine tRNA methylthiotransferase MtaB
VSAERIVPAPGRSAGRDRSPRRAAVVNLGCKVNQAEVEAAARMLRANGVELVGARQPADLVLVNTCTVTSVADQKSRQAVRRARRASPDATVVVTGCSAQIDPEAIRSADPSAVVIGNDGKDGLLLELERSLGPGWVGGPTRDRDRLDGGDRLDGDPGDADRRTLDAPLPTLSGVEVAGPARRLDGIADDRTESDRTRAFVKVQDGCSFYCTYCIIPRARGPERSLDPEVVLADVRRALDGGHREIVLTGINIGTYDGGWSESGPRGSHARSALTLAGLVRRILAETDVERIRLSSIEPQHVDDELLDAWTGPGRGRCLPHLHLPLQSGDDGVLRRMGRRYDAATYAAVVARARAAIPGVAIHADVIAGFPTEDDEAFERSLRFIEALRLDGLHVFRYSARPGTPAVRMTGQVDEPTRRERSNRLLDIAARARARRVLDRVGTTASVLFEERLPDGRWMGHAEDHCLVAVAASIEAMDNAVGRVAVDGADATRDDLAVGRVLSVDPARRAIARGRRPLPVLAAGGRTRAR